MTDEPVAVDLPVVMGDRRLAGTGRLSVTAGLSLIVAASVAIRVVLASTVAVPTIFPDELGFWELGRGIGESGRWLLGGKPVVGFTYGPLYPLLIAPTHLAAHSLVDAYELTKILNALLMSLSAVPAYFLARRVVSVRGSLFSAGLAVLVPSAVYTTHVMSESLSYPLFLCAMLTMAASVAHASARRQLVALTVIALTVLSRAEMVVLFPAYACAIVLLGWMEARGSSPQSFRRNMWSFKTTWLVYGAGTIVLLLFAVGGSVGPHIRGAILRSLGLGHSLPTGLPSAGQLRSLLGPVRPQAAPISVVQHLAELDLYSGVLPFAAFALVAIATLGLRKFDRPRAEFVALSVSVGAWLVVLAAFYETTFKLYGVISTHVFDRYVFYVVPLFVIALVAWVEDGLPRPRWIAGAIALIAALLPVVLPLAPLLNGHEWGTSTSTVGMIPLVWAKVFVGDGWLLRALLLCVTSTLALVFLRARPRRGWALVGICTLVFGLSSVLVAASNTLLSERASADAGHNDLAWVDEAVGAGKEVAIVWRGNSKHPQPQRLALREAEFFNRSIGPIYDLQDPLSTGFPTTGVTLRRGRVVTTTGHQVRAAYVLAHRSLLLVGRPIASDSGSGLVLYRVRGPVRLRR